MAILILSFFLIFFSLWLLSHYLEFGWYVLVFLAPLRQWTISLSDYHNILSISPRLGNIYAPVVEFWAVALLAAWLLHLLRLRYHGETVFVRLPAGYWYGLFIFTAAISLFAVEHSQLAGSIRYIFRYLVFCYIAFLALGATLMSSQRVWEKSLVAFTASGVCAAAMGLTSLIMGNWRDVYGVFRATPFSLAGWAPFGHQHIFLAEALVIALPAALYLLHKQWIDTRKRRILLLITVAITMTALLTLSRAAWLALAVEGLVAVWLWHGRLALQTISRCFRFLALAVVPILIYFIFFLMTSDLVTSSNFTRWSLTDFSWFYFLRHPLIGNGVGTFLPLVSETWYFILEFGEPVDAHGLAHKLLTEQGLFGLGAFAMFIFILTRRLLTQARHNMTWIGSVATHLSARYGLVMLAGTFVFQLFNTQYYSSVMWVPLALAASAHYHSAAISWARHSHGFLSGQRRFFVEYK